MTTIIMRQLEGDVMVGWDSMTTQGHEVSNMVQPKVVRNGPAVFGVSGTTLALDIMGSMKLPAFKATEDPHKWLVEHVGPQIRAITEPSLVDEESGGLRFAVLAALGGRCFEFDGQGSPSSRTSGIHAIGSGCEYALGAMYICDDVLEGLFAAKEYDAFTGGTLTVVLASDILKGKNK